MEFYRFVFRSEMPKSMIRFVIESCVVHFLLGFGLILILTNTNPIKLLLLWLRH